MTIQGFGLALARRLGIAICAAALSGCGTVGGTPILSARGPVDTGATTGLAYRFNQSATAANTSDTPENVRKMLVDGFGLVYANCNDYFESAGRAQTWVITARDIVQVASALSTGAIALDNGSDDTVAAIAFGSNAIYSGLDVYTRNFLFGAENVDSVRTLILRAVATHRDAVLAQNPVTYMDVTQALLDNQTICSPRRIASLVRAAIASGDIVASQPSDGVTQAVAQADQHVLLELGQLLGLSGAVSTEQAGALWWYTMAPAPDDNERAFIQATLATVPAAQSPFAANGTPKANWDLRPRVAAMLGLLSPPNRRALEAWIATAKPQIAAAAAAAAAGGNPGPLAIDEPVFTTPLSTSTRVEISVH